MPCLFKKLSWASSPAPPSLPQKSTSSFFFFCNISSSVTTGEAGGTSPSDQRPQAKSKLFPGLQLLPPRTQTPSLGTCCSLPLHSLPQILVCLAPSSHSVLSSEQPSWPTLPKGASSRVILSLSYSLHGTHHCLRPFCSLVTPCIFRFLHLDLCLLKQTPWVISAASVCPQVWHTVGAGK